MNLILLFCLCTALSLSEQTSRQAGPSDKPKFRTRALVERKSYLVPLKTRFVLKCSSSRFGLRRENDFSKDDQFDDDRPELIVLNNLEQTKKLVDYFSEKGQTQGRIELVGWNRTALDRVHRRAEKSGKKEERQFDRMYESMFLSGKGFFRPNENVDLFGQGQSCLLFTSFGKKDEAIYSCLYKPGLAWSNLLDPGGWMSRLSGLFDSDNDKELDDLNLNNNVPLTEQLIYITCLLTWPFNHECHLVKQFKLTVDSEPKDEDNDYWNGLNSHEMYRLKKLLKELVKHCHPTSSARHASPNKRVPHKEGGRQRGGGGLQRDSQKGDPKDETSSGFIGDFFRLLFDDLFVGGFTDLISGVFSGLFSDLFSGLFSGLFGGLFSSLFSGLIDSTVSELLPELIGELFVDPFKDMNLFYLICVLLFIFVCLSAENDPRPCRKPSNWQTSETNGKKNAGIDLHIDAQIGARLRDEESSQKDSEHGLSIRPQSAGKKKQNLKFSLDASVTNKSRRRKKGSKDFRLQTGEDAFAISSIPKIESEQEKKFGVRPRLGGLISGSRKVNEPEDNHRERIESSVDLKPSRFRDAFRWTNRKKEADQNEPDQNKSNQNELTQNELDQKGVETNEKVDENLEFKGEIVISKQGEVSYLGKFLFNLPEQLDEKPLQLILETTNSLNGQLTGRSTDDLPPSLSRDLGHEPTNDRSQADSQTLANHSE